MRVADDSCAMYDYDQKEVIEKGEGRCYAKYEEAVRSETSFGPGVEACK